VTASADGTISVKGATYRCAGNRMTMGALQDNEPDPSSTAIRMIVKDHDVKGFVRTMDEATLGHVWIAPGDGRLPVYSLSNPAVDSENQCQGWNWYESRAKRYVSSESDHAALVSMGWRDNGVAFYVPAAKAATTTTIYSDITDKAQLYFGEGAEAKMRGDGAAVFEVLKAPGKDTKPLMRVYYLQACANSHDELMVGKARFERAYNQGSGQPHFGLHWSGLTAETTLVVEALDALCPYQGGLAAGVSVPAEGGHAAWKTVSDLRAQSKTGEVYINAQGDGTTSRPIARSFVTVSPKAARSCRRLAH
jgi:hypothetical protein